MLDHDLLSLMPQSVSIEPYCSGDAWGNPIYGTAVSYRGRVVNKRKRVISVGGQDVVSETTAYLATASGIHTEDRITLPSGYLPRRPPIIRVGRFPDESGAVYYTEVNC